MEHFITETLHMPLWAFDYIVLPLLIFLGRVADMSIGTMRVIFVMSGKRKIAPLLGFFESLVWLLAIRQIFQNVDNAFSYLAYAGGFATGTYMGMYIEEKLAIGRVVVRIFTKSASVSLVEFLRRMEYRFANLEAEGNEGQVNVVFTVVKREHLPDLLTAIKEHDPHAFYTIEGVKRASDEAGLRAETKGKLSMFYRGARNRA